MGSRQTNARDSEHAVRQLQDALTELKRLAALREGRVRMTLQHVTATQSELAAADRVRDLVQHLRGFRTRGQ